MELCRRRDSCSWRVGATKTLTEGSDPSTSHSAKSCSLTLRNGEIYSASARTPQARTGSCSIALRTDRTTAYEQLIMIESTGEPRREAQSPAGRSVSTGTRSQDRGGRPRPIMAARRRPDHCGRRARVSQRRTCNRTYPGFFFDYPDGPPDRGARARSTCGTRFDG